jgi:DNA-binding MarR family transcriptional regulator
MAEATPDHLDRIVAQWRRERPDLNTEPMALLGRLFRAAQLADAALAERLAAHGLQPGWFDLLAALRRAGPPYQLNPTQLTHATMLSSGGMTKRLDRLAAAGLIERHPDPGDRRGTLVRLTRGGKAAIDAALGTHLAGEEQLLSTLGSADRRALDQLLRRLLTGLERPGGATPSPGVPGPDRAAGAGCG